MGDAEGRYPTDQGFDEGYGIPNSSDQAFWPDSDSWQEGAHPDLEFAYVPYTQTHEPVDAHPDFKGSTGNGSFADVLAQTDAYVSELLDTIDEPGLKDDTIFSINLQFNRRSERRRTRKLLSR